MNNTLKTSVLMVVLASTSVAAQTNLIDFETLPGGASPSEGMAISNQFWTTHGVSFVYTNGTFPVVAMDRGTRTYAFLNNSNFLTNAVAPLQGTGRFFLTDPDTTNHTKPPPLIISYRDAVSNASGVMIDIDGGPNKTYEAWDLTASDAGGQPLGTIHMRTNSPNAGDATAAPWSFRSVQGIRSIRIDYVGSKERVGLAFDNFSPALPVAPPALTIAVTQRVAHISLAGSFNERYRVEWASSLFPVSWQTLISDLHLTNTPQQAFIDYAPSNTTIRFYRAVGF